MNRSAHVEYDDLADLAEDLLEGDRAAAVNDHLDGCAECRELSADLADVSRLLAETPLPSMPPDLISRIDSVIAAESLNNATVISLDRRRQRRGWRYLSVAAAAVIVVGGGAVVAQTVLENGGPSDTAAHSPPADPTRAADAPPAATTGWQATSSGTAYQQTTLDTQVKRLLDRRKDAVEASTQPEADLLRCVRAVIGEVPPAAVDTGTFDGDPAAVIVTKQAGGTQVWAVDCAPTTPRVLHHTG